MAEKTEQPTPKKLKKAREEGQVARSGDLSQAFLFAVALGVLMMTGEGMQATLLRIMMDFYSPTVLTGDLPTERMLGQFAQGIRTGLATVLPLFGAIFIGSIAVNFLQVGASVTMKPLMPKIDKLNPINGLKKYTQAHTYIELVKNLFKLLIIFLLAYVTIKGDLRDILLTSQTTLTAAVALTSLLFFGFFKKVAAVFGVIGAADFMLQKKQHNKQLMMSKEEVEREYKEDEGDPHIKHQRQHFMQELIDHAVAKHVPEATGVVRNPTHIAIAFKYDAAKMNAPRVTAKGKDKVAQEIMRLAEKNDVPILTNVPLAHALYKVELDAEIPEDLYAAMAAIIQLIEELEAKRKGGPPPEEPPEVIQ